VKDQPRGLAVSRKQCCDILGWTVWQFDKSVSDGMPIADRPTSRGTDYVVFMGDVIRWLVEREMRAAGVEPAKKLDLNVERARQAKAAADKLELENALARKDLLPSDEVSKTLEVSLAALRDRVMAITSVMPLIRERIIAGDEAGAGEKLRKALTDALEDVGKVEFVEADAA
jgi:phage terminase Nu1 subunit (DNA packaging protein)